MITNVTRINLIDLFRSHDPAPLMALVDQINGNPRDTGII